jgi:hypothetical protein
LMVPKRVCPPPTWFAPMVSTANKNLSMVFSVIPLADRYAHSPSLLCSDNHLPISAERQNTILKSISTKYQTHSSNESSPYNIGVKNLCM